MTDAARTARLDAEYKGLVAMCREREVHIAVDGSPPNAYRLELHVAGIAAPDGVLHHVHRIEIQLPSGFPDEAPVIHWRTPVFHPNVSLQGDVDLAEIRREWSPQHGLDEVVTRLWDMARGAYWNAERASNPVARDWYQAAAGSLPFDIRPLRRSQSSSNTICYELLSAAPRADLAPEAAGEVLFIDDDTPVPDLPRGPPLPPSTGTDGEDVWFIGDE
ncbi:MAG: ubiquitin-conjugating enzyme E2 [Pirellulaceae bacterium]